MPNDPVRELLGKLCAERGESFAALSRLLGRNDAYFQQYLRKGTPRRLPEKERGILARYFQVPEALLGAPENGADFAHGLVQVARMPIRVSAGPGRVAEDERGIPSFGFEPRWLKTLTATPSSRLTVVRVDGDSMSPTLVAGDDVLVDHDDCATGLRDGIYVIRVDDTLMVKRLALHPLGRKVTIQSDNPAYADWPDCEIGEIHCVGRVIWAGRRIG